MTNILLGFAGVAVFVGAFLILNTFSIIVAQRTQELALMRALGGTRRQLVSSVLLEAALVGFVAALIGIGLGIGIGDVVARLLIGRPTARYRSRRCSSRSRGWSAACSSAPSRPCWRPCSRRCGRRASRPSPPYARRPTQPKPMIRLAIAGGGLTAVGAGLVVYMANPTQLLIGVLCAFVGVALLTPLFAGPVVSGLGRLVKPVGPR